MNREYINLLNFDNDHHVGLLCSYLSTIAYQNKDTQKKWLIDRFKLSGFISDESESMQYFTLYDTERKIFFVVIRGTDIKRIRTQWKDVLVSLNCWPKKIDDYRIHSGYYHASKKVYNKVKKSIENAEKEGYRIIFTGHSLGGAIAKYLAVKSNVYCDVYTFGAPMLATSEFYQGCNIKTINKYVVHGDLVAEFPSSIFDDHYPTYYELKNGSCEEKYQKNLGLLIPFLYLSKLTLLSRFIHAFKAHSMKTYTYNLLRYINKLDKDK